MPGILYIVPTPIGNLEDITLRALRVLKEVELIAAEDTRHTRNLLAHFGIKTALTSYHEHNERNKSRSLVERLKSGASIALVSDAGTPAISDPGYRIVVDAIEAGLQVIPLPGASALTTALSASGLPTDRFLFEGFLPAKPQERKVKLQALRSETATLVFYEAPHRLTDSLADMLKIFGDREIAMARELTKVHEEFRRGKLSEIVGPLDDHEIKGELVIVVQGATGEAVISDAELQVTIRQLRGEGMGVKEIAELLGERYGLAKKHVYKLALEVKAPTRAS
ncbi:MAG TPA: 16S rRNA (cytidine(1402)-2'-O)-methyltransferase [Candidatus Binatia bacterium]|nr:16S rRNA (cytidine(1402)-2'-O)-methyltransferase [Candidatus Binatia bacterium]